MFRVPGMTAPGTRCRRPVTLLDIYPTLVELAGLAPPGHLDGHSLVPLLKDPAAERAVPALTAFDSHMTVRTDRYRLIRYTDGTTELYDREQDPHDWVNQTDNAAYAETKKRLLAVLPKPEEMAPSMPSKKRKKKRK